MTSAEGGGQLFFMLVLFRVLFPAVVTSCRVKVNQTTGVKFFSMVCQNDQHYMKTEYSVSESLRTPHHCHKAP